MLQSASGTGRIARPADIHFTRCPNAKLLRIPSRDAGNPNAAGYAERRLWAGCGRCEKCEQDRIVKRVMTWSQRLKAVLSYEVEVRGSDIQLASLTFPRHPEGDPERDHAPDEEMYQAARAHFITELDNWYNRHGVKRKDACNLIGFVEEGGQFGRIHSHDIFCFRPGFPHPHTEEERELLPTLDRYGNRQWLDGLGQIWRKILTNRGYAPLQNWYRSPPKSPAELAGYLTSAYLVKGFLSDKTFRVRAGQQSPPFEEVIDWWRDKRFKLEGKSYRRWVGFKVHVTEINVDNIKDECRKLAAYYAKSYRESVSIEGRRLSRYHVSEAGLTMAFLRGLSEHMSTISEKRRRLGEDAGIPVCMEFRPILICLSDRPVRHPARADFISVANYYADTDSFGDVERIDRPSELVDADARYNLCGASHWFPFDTELHVRDTEAFEEIVGWNTSVTSKFNEVVIRILQEVLPGNAFSFIVQGMSAPTDIIDEERVNRVASAFPEVFPDRILSGLTEPAYETAIGTQEVTLGDTDDIIVSALERCASWPELTDIRASEAVAPGMWPEFQLKRGQVEIVNRIHEEHKSGIYALPTSFGKSLCYQIPNVSDGITLVVSPLLSLIRDQYQALLRKNVNVTWVGGEHNTDVKVARLEQVGAIGRTVDDQDNLHCIVYMAPETFDPGILTRERVVKDKQGNVTEYYPGGEERLIPRLLRDGSLNVSHLVIDECHCITEWADFRKSYSRIASSIATWHYPPKVVSLFSATISPRILRSLWRDFGWHLNFFALPMARSNLFLKRRPVGFYDFFAYEWQTVKLPAVVYCGQKLRAEEVASFLRAQGISAMQYHAGMDDKRWCDRNDRELISRAEVETAFRTGEVDVLCATVAYGMGVDHGSIRTVIHDAYPETLEHYAQQIGRAGRDGNPSECILLHNPGMIPSPDLWSYFHTDGCLWEFIARGHGQPASACGHCDGCLGTETFIPES